MINVESILEIAIENNSLKPTGFDGNPDGYDKAIVGITSDSRLVYSKEKMIEICAEAGEMEILDAIEFLEFNTFYDQPGDGMPMFINTGYEY
jgi:hypothetical protein